ncbi:hypothetical protein GCM10022254_21990 [Actinomadura meridiana]|uniref:Uncharacterized protein n=1 Tax=Actinomadura meridiana TaxID=559626 RepID=A0ABP8BYG6_9ACTN
MPCPPVVRAGSLVVDGVGWSVGSPGSGVAGVVAGGVTVGVCEGDSLGQGVVDGAGVASAADEAAAVGVPDGGIRQAEIPGETVTLGDIEPLGEPDALLPGDAGSGNCGSPPASVRSPPGGFCPSPAGPLLPTDCWMRSMVWGAVTPSPAITVAAATARTGRAQLTVKRSIPSP